MPTVLGSLRRLLMAPSPLDVDFAARGFPVPPSPATRRLEAIPQAVVCGFEWAIDDPGHRETEARIRLVDAELRGFAYEGATMALTLRDAMAPTGGGRARRLLLGPAGPHVFLAYIGIGFALARLPRRLWKKAVPDLTGAAYPQMSWLAVDGYGFDLAYFHTGRYVDEQRVPAPYDWEGHPGYFARAVDQGIGRALWFIHGARADRVAAAVDGFDEARRPDLWSGVGLAATFAGSFTESDLALLRRAADGHRGELGQGAVFAAKARAYAGTVPEHTHTALGALAGLTLAGAVALADDCAVEPGTAPGGGAVRPGDIDGVPAYEQWRLNIRDRISTTAG
ncbi:DUF1702 family protein [Streptomyces yaizuensis]|uniref:DUF1702 family protein n=1 Tax=Streptomyces yaizuensis TaxID=2989713 RepID=A0ABQ5P893_9ACTN|nr:DUF1702 family protein [Streptomyces sp. YSPA8]GLF98788.1 DUF1702 family protein [Streptomyces sp. YSPA8]